jgi:tripartite-type tricarboxylate transporter receptor subunit TctC
MNAAKTTPVKVAIDGFGSVEDLVTKFFASKGLKFVGIPFPKPGERYAAILGSQVDVMCDPNGNVRRYVEAGQVRPVLVFSEKRVAEIPGTPTASELGYKVAVSEWRSIVAKAGTPPATVQFLAETLAQAYKTAAFQDFLKSTWSVSDSFVSYKDMPGFLKAREQEIKSLQAATR